jgi:hypothetical protein
MWQQRVELRRGVAAPGGGDVRQDVAASIRQHVRRSGPSSQHSRSPPAEAADSAEGDWQERAGAKGVWGENRSAPLLGPQGEPRCCHPSAGRAGLSLRAAPGVPRFGPGGQEGGPSTLDTSLALIGPRARSTCPRRTAGRNGACAQPRDARCADRRRTPDPGVEQTLVRGGSDQPAEKMLRASAIILVICWVRTCAYSTLQPAA